MKLCNLQAHSVTSCTDPEFGGKSWTGEQDLTAFKKDRGSSCFLLLKPCVLGPDTVLAGHLCDRWWWLNQRDEKTYEHQASPHVSRHDILRRCTRSKLAKPSYLTYSVGNAARPPHTFCWSSLPLPSSLPSKGMSILWRSSDVCAECGSQRRADNCWNVAALAASSFLPNTSFSHCQVPFPLYSPP